MVQKVAWANRKGIKNTFKMRPKCISKSMNNRNTIHARKRDTQKMTSHPKNNLKMSWGMRQNSNEKHVKNDRTKDEQIRKSPGAELCRGEPRTL